MKTKNEPQYVICSRCNVTPMEISEDAISGVCWRCVQIRCGPPEALLKKEPKIKKQRGWQWMSVYVDVEGNVYHRGVEQPDLKDTLPPTPRKEPVKKQKETFQDKMEKDKRILDMYKKRKVKRKK